MGSEGLVCGEERVGEDVVYPCSHFWPVCAVRTVAFGGPSDRAMGFPHDRDSSFDLWDRSIGGFGYIDGGAREATEGVLSVC